MRRYIGRGGRSSGAAGEVDNSRLSRANWSRTVAQAYQAIHRTAEPEDSWHACTTAQIATFLNNVLSGYRQALILDAGCGGFEYVGPPHRVVGIDMIHTSLLAKPRPSVVGDIHALPFAEASFDCVICVGSVANYIDIHAAAREFARVLIPNGLVVIEYERSRSWRTLGSRRFGRDCVRAIVRYKGIQHALYLYSDQYFEKMLRSAGLSLVGKRYFHYWPAFVHGLMNRFIPPTDFPVAGTGEQPVWMKYFAANVIMIYSRD